MAALVVLRQSVGNNCEGDGELAQCILDRQLRSEVWNILELIDAEHRVIHHAL